MRRTFTAYSVPQASRQLFEPYLSVFEQPLRCTRAEIQSVRRDGKGGENAEGSRADLVDRKGAGGLGGGDRTSGDSDRVSHNWHHYERSSGKYEPDVAQIDARAEKEYIARTA